MTQITSNRICKLGDVVTFTGGFSFKSSEWKTTGVPVIKIANVRDGKVTLDGCSFVDQASAKESDAYKVQKDDLLMTLTGEIGAMGFYKETFEARLNQRLCKVSVKNADELSLEYVHYFLTSPTVRQVMWQMSKGAAQANISVKDIAGIQIPMPPLQEQQRIVEALDDHLSRLDKALAELDHADAQMHVLRRSILNELLTNKVSDSVLGARRMNELPSDWVTRRLVDVAEVIMGQSPPGSTYNKSGAGVPFFQGKAEFGSKHPTVRQWTTAGTKFARAGDVLMSVRAPVGPTNIADQDCAIGRGLAAIRAGSQLNQSYLIWYLKHVEASIQSRGKGTTFDAISGNDLRDTPVNLPPLDQQRRIVEVLEDRLSQLDSTRTSIASQRASIHALRRSLLNKAFNGELGTR
jgi:type I restriction enzyme S subunit